MTTFLDSPAFIALGLSMCLGICGFGFAWEILKWRIRNLERRNKEMRLLGSGAANREVDLHRTNAPWIPNRRQHNRRLWN